MFKIILVLTLISGLCAQDNKFLLGKTIYEKTCISCHGVDGNADENLHLVVMPRSLKKSILNEEQSYQIIKKGARYWGSIADIMPSFDTVYDENELRAVSYYISQNFNPNVDQKIEELYAKSMPIPKEKIFKMAKRGKKIYKRNCSWCHGLTGKGDGEATRNPEKSIYPYNLTKTLLSEKQMFLYAKYGGEFFGTHKDDMPSWKRKYNDFTLKSVVQYIKKEF